MKIHKSALVPYLPRDMFALVADIEAYPEFLPWCTEARVLARQGNQVTARVALAKSGIRQSFVTRNVQKECERIDMHLVEGPFKRLRGFWSFEPVGSHGCVVALNLEFELASKLLAVTFGKVFHSIANSLIDAFCTRARELHERRSAF